MKKRGSEKIVGQRSRSVNRYKKRPDHLEPLYILASVYRSFLKPFLSLHVQVADVLGVRLDEALAGIHRIAHQHIEGAVGLGGIVHRHQQQGAVIGIHGGLPQLHRVHFAQTFVSRDG